MFSDLRSWVGCSLFIGPGTTKRTEFDGSG
jgi:hypothetical protein